MRQSSFDRSYSNRLLQGVLGTLGASAAVRDGEDVSVESLPFDDRIQMFQMLSKSLLFAYDDVSKQDLEYWFPECPSSNAKGSSTVKISKEEIETSLECVVARLFEDDF